MRSEYYEIMEYDQESDGQWYATVLIIGDGEPKRVYRVQSDPPVYAQPEEQPND